MRREDLQDVQLLGRVAGGDSGAFALLFDRHASTVLGLLVRMLRDRAEAEEVLQEAFFQAWRQAGSYRPERASARGWLLMLARSRAVDRIRSSKARSRREEEVGAGDYHRAGVAPEAQRRLEEREQSRQVHDALAGLPEEQRTCIELAFFGGLSHTQIAERVGRPLGTVKSRIALGMRKLRETLGPARGEA